MSESYDVVVVGGGLVGLSTALLLDAAVSQRLRIAIVEARPPALPSSWLTARNESQSFCSISRQCLYS